jgi:PAS domain S-box-containing protein
VTSKLKKEISEDGLIHYQNLPVPYQSLDEKGNIIAVNQAWLDKLGYQAHEVISSNFALFLAPGFSQGFKSAFSNFKSKGSVSDIRFKMLHKSGILIDVSFEGMIEYDEKGNFVKTHCVFKDITQDEFNRQKLLKQFEQEKIIENKLNQAQKFELVGHLAGGIAHDFNNLLQVIHGYSSLLIDNLSEDSPEKELASDILYSTEKAGVLTSQLLAFSQKQVLSRAKIDINTLLSDLLRMIKRAAGEQIELIFSPSHDLLITMADPIQLEQVILNICVNARHAMNKGGILRIATKLKIIDQNFCASSPEAQPGTYVYISIQDDGEGIDEINKGRIFEPFFTTKELGKGTGMGLAAVDGIIKQHGGFIDVISNKNRGTDFQIYLPAGAGSDTSNSGMLKGAAVKDKTIFIAEDDISVRRLVSRILQRAGYNVICAEDGVDAINKLKENTDSIHLLLLDLIMPKKSGKDVYEFYQSIDSNDSKKPVLFMSGYTSGMLDKTFLKQKNIDFISKPFSSYDLLDRIAGMIGCKYQTMQ